MSMSFETDDLLSLFILEYLYLAVLAVITRRDMDVPRAHARDRFADERRSGALDIIERGIQQYLELIAEPFEHGQIQGIYFLRVHPAFQSLRNDLRQGDDGGKGRRVRELETFFP